MEGKSRKRRKEEGESDVFISLETVKFLRKKQ